MVYIRPVLLLNVARSARTEKERSSFPMSAPTISGPLSPVPMYPACGSLLVTETRVIAGLESQLSWTEIVAVTTTSLWSGEGHRIEGDRETLSVGAATSRICNGTESVAVSPFPTKSLKATEAEALMKSPGQASAGTVKLLV